MMLARKLVKSGWVFGLMFIGLLLAGCETLQTGGSTAHGSTNQPAPVINPRTINIIAAGDRLTIEFTDVSPGLAPVNATVRADGTISLPHNVTLKAEGKTWSDLANEIHSKYVPHIYRRLTVIVRGEDRYYTVTGEVRNPGPKSYMGQMTTLKAIAAAGDFTEFGKRTNVKVTRANGKIEKVNAKKARSNPALDIPVYPGDIVHVERRIF